MLSPQSAEPAYRMRLSGGTQKPPSTEVHLDVVNEQAHDYVRQAATLISAKPQSQALRGTSSRWITMSSSRSSIMTRIMFFVVHVD